MKIYIGADHRGFKLKEQLIDWLRSKNDQVIDAGNTVYDPEDDYPDFVQNVIVQMTNYKLQNTNNLGIVICGSGVGVSIAANRTKGIRCVLGFNSNQVKHARAHDHVNVLALGADYIDLAHTQEMVTAFLNTIPNNQEKYLRRIKKLDEEG